MGPVGDQDRFRAMGDKVPGGKLGHLPGPEEKNGLFIQGAEYFSGQLRGDGADGDGFFSDFGLIADLFATRKARENRPVRVFPVCPASWATR